MKFIIRFKIEIEIAYPNYVIIFNQFRNGLPLLSFDGWIGGAGEWGAGYP